ILTALQIHFNTPPSSILSVEDGVEQARWLPGARLNIAESCFRGRRADVPALIWRREGDETLGRMTIDALHQRSRTVAGALAALGHKPGQAFAIDMPMTVESVVIYLGIVLFGGVVVSIADSFAPAEIATRIRISDTVLIFTQDVIVRGERRLPLYSRVLAADGPRAVVLPAEATLSVQLREGDVSWTTFLSQGRSALLSPHISDASATTNILFSSGTTGDPKAIPWTQVTPIKAAADAFAHHDVQPGDVVAWPTNLGWMMGPWLIYASLLNGATIALYQGAPTGRGFCTFVQDAKVNVLGVVPSIVRAWRATDATQGLDWSSVRTFSSTGEVSNPDDMLWLMSRAGYSPIIEYCGGTELGGGYIAGSRMQPQAPSTFSSPTMGCAFTILSGDGAATDDGEIALIPPILGSSQRLLNRDHHQVYFANMPTGPHEQPLRRHGDQIRHIGGGYYRALGRVDDTMNLGGIKTSSAEIERACETVAGLHDVAAIAVPPPGGGPERLVLVAVAEPGRELDAEAVRLQAQQAIRAALNPLFKVAAVRFVDALPRTASNKVMRRILRRDVMATGEG
ncbi:MAG: AMP-binding protein, partial [Myxococcota bacterium]